MTTPSADAPTDTVAPDTPEPDPTPEAPQTETSDTPDETAKWKAMARKHETEARKLAKQIADLQAAQMSDQEKAIAEAEQRGAATVRTDLGKRIAAAELKAAGVPADVVDDFDLTRYVTDTGDVDSEAVAATAAKFAAFAPKPVPSVPTGPQSGSGPAQLTRDDLKRMKPEEIVKAQNEGRLADLLGVKPNHS